MAKAKEQPTKAAKAAEQKVAQKATNDVHEHKLRVLVASAEAVPFAKTGGLGDVAGTLPAALCDAGVKASVVLPKYSSISPELFKGAKAVCELDVPMPSGAKRATIERASHDGVDFFLVGNDEYFARDKGLYGYDDDGERFAFFSRAICEAIAHSRSLACDVVHCNDWQTALVPVYLRELYRGVKACDRVRTVFTVHNAKFQGQGPESMLADVTGLERSPLATVACTLDDGSVNLMKGALVCADYLTTVSPTYVDELQTPNYGEGLESLFRRRHATFSGVLNGIDQDAWNPATDKQIAANYTASDLSGKAECKRALQKEMGLNVDETRPLVAMVTRLTDQKGVHLVCEAMHRMMQRGIQLVILGTGDPWFENELASYAIQYPNQLAAEIKFDGAMSHRIYAGADLFLMPSLFEPCGLSQMISMRYGTLPVVRETGGLRDSVNPYNKYTGEGNGFSFANADAREMADILFYACETFWNDKPAWNKLQQQALSANFTWTRAAQDYLHIYQEICD